MLVRSEQNRAHKAPTPSETHARWDTRKLHWPAKEGSSFNLSIQSRIDLRMFSGRPPGGVMQCLQCMQQNAPKTHDTLSRGCPDPCTGFKIIRELRPTCVECAAAPQGHGQLEHEIWW